MPSRILLRPRYILCSILSGHNLEISQDPVSFKEIADDCLEVEFKSVQFEKNPKKFQKFVQFMNNSIQKSRESGVCPKNFYCPRGTLKTQREQSSCPRNHYCPAGSMTGVPCPLELNLIRRKDQLMTVFWTKIG